MGGTGGSSTIDQTDVNQRPELRRYQNFERKQLDQYVKKSPLLSRAEGGATGFWDQLGGMLSGLQEQYGGISKDLQSQFGGLPEYLTSNFGEGSATMEGYNKFIDPTLRSGGALSPEAARNATIEARNAFASRGNVFGNQAVIGEYEGREAEQRERFDTALRQAGGVQAGQTGLAQAAQGLGTGLAQTRQGLGTGLAGALQGLQTGGLNQLLGVETSEVANYTTLMNPAKQFLSNILGLKSQESIQQAAINQQGNINDQNKMKELLGSAIESAGSVVGGAVGMSDERLKQKIRDTGLKTEKGVKLKVFEYRTRPGVKFLGAMAQDIEKRDPAAVRTDPVSGVKTVGFRYFPVQLTAEAA